MKLHPTNTRQYQTITAYDEQGVEINAQRFEQSLIVLPEQLPTPWNVQRFDDLNATHFEFIATFAPDMVILGTGHQQRFIHSKYIAPLTTQHKGVECMDNKAACRTYNILMAEGRKVALALVMEATK